MHLLFINAILLLSWCCTYEILNMEKAMKHKKPLLPYVAISLFLILITLTVYRFFYQARVDTDLLIAQDVKRLATILEAIDEKCKIINFDYQKNWIDFLHIKKDGFIGSELGSMNLAYPSSWQGPYLQDNPTMQKIAYQVVKTKKGYFVVPGEGVRLGNGKVIGKDIIFDENADIAKMTTQEGVLLFKGQRLAVPLNIDISQMRAVLMEDLVAPEEDFVFNESMKKFGALVKLAGAW